jgi:hypothetical protein
MMAVAGAFMVLSRLPSLRCGNRGSFAVFDFTPHKACRQAIVGGWTHLGEGDQFSQRIVGYLARQRPVRACGKKQLLQRSIVQSHPPLLPALAAQRWRPSVGGPALAAQRWRPSVGGVSPPTPRVAGRGW